VIWIVGLLPGGEVAAGITAVRGRDGEVVIVVDVAGSARHVGMAVGQREAGAAVIKLCAQPGVEEMALLAIGGGECRARTGVIRIGGVLPIFQVARIALRGKAEKLSDSGALVAGIARYGGVGAE